MTETITIYLENRNEDIDIDVDVEFDILNDGIGPYEFWGQKCFDKGKDYLEVVGVEWDKTGFTEEEVEIIKKEIDKLSKEWDIDGVVSDSGE